MSSSEGLLVTSDGEEFRGTSVGVDGISTGEVVFNTSMTGYQEILTDPSYAGQVVVMTASHIGNYGVTSSDDQAERPHVSGFVVRAMSRRDSSWRSDGTLGSYLHRHEVVALSDVDTRRLTRHVRDRGAQPVALGSGVDRSELVAAVAAAPSMTGLDLATGVGTRNAYEIPADGPTKGSIVAIDLGLKRDILRHLSSRGLEIRVVPPGTPADDIVSERPDGVFVSNGPGDPEPLTATVESLRGLLGRMPVFGICLGHQVLGLALGARTFKLAFGHHGGNHPVRDLSDGRVQITAQNHGFAVDLWSLSDDNPPPRNGLVGPDLLPEWVDSTFGRVIPTHQNLNDGTLEGLRCTDVGAFGIQYHPEAAPGPTDAAHLFDEFVDSLGIQSDASGGGV